MTDVTLKLDRLLKTGFDYVSKSSDLNMQQRQAPTKWSKKEILGHLIDSAINNLQRFTEIQFESKPYKIRSYDQNGLVKANNYHNASPQEIAGFWLALNSRILELIRQQTENTINYKIEMDNGVISDLRFLITDYVDHLEHHLNQILK